MVCFVEICSNKLVVCEICMNCPKEVSQKVFRIPLAK